MKIVGITGSIGCGKTTIAELCRDLGYGVYDVDAAVRRLYHNKEFLKKIKENFPSTFENGVFDKRALRNLVFGDNIRLKRLEALIHPFLREVLKEKIRKGVKVADILFIDIALLFEMGWEKYCDFIILADVEKQIQKKRVMKRDNISAEDFDKIVKVQMNNEDKKLLADIVVDTDKKMNLLKVEIIKIIDGIKNA